MCWYKNKEMVSNHEKFQSMLIGLNDDITLFIDINDIVVQMPDNVQLLGVTIDSMLNFNQHVKLICKVSSNKFKAFARIAPNLEYEKMLCYTRFCFIRKKFIRK